MDDSTHPEAPTSPPSLSLQLTPEQAAALLAAAGQAPKKPRRKKPPRLPVFFLPAQASALLAAAEEPREFMLVLSGLYLGLRVDELVKLRITDVDLVGRSVFVQLGKGKKDRYVPVPPDLAGALEEWIGDRPDGWLFPGRNPAKPLTCRAVQKIMKRLAIRAQLPGAAVPRKCTPHKMRHTYATMLLDSGANLLEVQELLGHASLSTTQIYLHVMPGRLKSAVDRLRFGDTKGVVS
jgi:integrase/recombinase XerD